MQLVKRLGPTYAEVLSNTSASFATPWPRTVGWEVDTQGDSFFVAFRRAKSAVAAAEAIQRDLAAHMWPGGGHVQVRIGLHTGAAARRRGLLRRLCEQGGLHRRCQQRSSPAIKNDSGPRGRRALPGVSICDLGERRLKDLERPERISQLVIEGLPDQFAQLSKTLDVPSCSASDGEWAAAQR